MINSIAGKTYTHWGVPYHNFKWKQEWNIFETLANKEINSLPFNCEKPIRHIMYWFDKNVLQQIGIEKKVTLDVRIRIVCGMINKLSPNRLSIELKREFMECIWDAYRNFGRSQEDWYCKYVLNLPF